MSKTIQMHVIGEGYPSKKVVARTIVVLGEGTLPPYCCSIWGGAWGGVLRPPAVILIHVTPVTLNRVE